MVLCLFSSIKINVLHFGLHHHHYGTGQLCVLWLCDSCVFYGTVVTLKVADNENLMLSYLIFLTDQALHQPGSGVVLVLVSRWRGFCASLPQRQQVQKRVLHAALQKC